MTTYQFSIDLNADLGEGIGNEAQLMPLISSCNIACGGHAGNDTSMRYVIKLAKENKVKIGAHPSFPDRVNFGRIPLEMSCAALFKSIKKQIDTLVTILDEEKLSLHHVKPHGALYNLAIKDTKIATVIVEVMQSMHLPVFLYVPYKSIIADMAKENKIPIIYEAFADRNYNDDLSLVSRKEDHAIIENEDEIFHHVFKMVSQGKVKTTSTKEVEIKAHTFCVHGDNPKAVSILTKLNDSLRFNGINIK